jgi:hypothetical protein
MQWFEVLSVVATGIAFISLILCILALTMKKSTMEKKVVFKDEEFSVKNGVIFARGFSNEPFKTNKQKSAVTSENVTSHTLTDGYSKMTEGNLVVHNQLSTQKFTDGNLIIEGGNLSTSGTINADRLHITRGISQPAEFYASVFLLEMNPVNFANIQEWKPINMNTSRTQLFFAAFDKLHHGVSVHNGNKIQLHQVGRWMYNFNFLTAAYSPVIIGASLSEKAPQLASGFGTVTSEAETSIASKESGRMTTHVNGSGVISVDDIDNLYQIWFQNMRQVDNYELQVLDGHLSLQYLGR